MRLSPSIRSGLLHSLALAANDEEPQEITLYRCPLCSEDHEELSWAEDCCEDEKNITVDASRGHCPVCADQFIGPAAAVDCCLWKDLTHAVRERIAAAVERGATWSEAIAKETQ